MLVDDKDRLMINPTDKRQLTTWDLHGDNSDDKEEVIACYHKEVVVVFRGHLRKELLRKHTDHFKSIRHPVKIKYLRSQSLESSEEYFPLENLPFNFVVSPVESPRDGYFIEI